MAWLHFGRVETTHGAMLVAESELGVVAASRSMPVPSFLERIGRRLPTVDPVPAEIDGSWLDDAFAGGPLPPVDLRGLAPWDAAVYRAVRGIPPGETATYGEIAASVGSPLAARAVGNALARCPLFPAVPCHRVVRAADGWSGWGGDVALKRHLLNAERAARDAT
jgi:O-6-methylguanine DNA methyltransferase